MLDPYWRMIYKKLWGNETVKKPSTPQQLAEDILHRSNCAVMVGAVIADRHGIFSWGWNHCGDGHGQHAEEYAINRANHKRLRGASIYVAGERKRSKRIVGTFPCVNCGERIVSVGIKRIYWRTSDGTWAMIYSD